MATVREGVMKKEVAKTPGKGIVKKVDYKKYTSDTDFVVRIIDREIEKRKHSAPENHIVHKKVLWSGRYLGGVL